MIFGTGIDIIEIGRIKNSIQKYSDRFKNKIFTQKEIDYCLQKNCEHDFIKKIMWDEYHIICVQNLDNEAKIKKEKVRKKTVTLTQTYYNEITK